MSFCLFVCLFVCFIMYIEFVLCINYVCILSLIIYYNAATIKFELTTSNISMLDIHTTNFSVWSYLTIVVLVGILLLLFAIYCEFDDHFYEFALKLVTFFFSVWYTLLTYAVFPHIFFWEIIGWISFRLISHWLDRQATSRGGLIALNTNRFGDVCIILFLLYSMYSYDNMYSTYISSFIVIGLLFKSISLISFL